MQLMCVSKRRERRESTDHGGGGEIIRSIDREIDRGRSMRGGDQWSHKWVPVRLFSNCTYRFTVVNYVNALE
jgi:hypothetical protein